LKDKEVKYYSTNLGSPEVTFREALLKGLAPDGGLYMPAHIPKLAPGEIKTLFTGSYPEIAFTILRNFTGREIEDHVLKSLCMDAYDFDIPIERVIGHSHVLRLDRGPSASFKDFAARMMARLIHYFISQDGRRMTILTATSGDTGSAVASAFHRLSNIDVIILFPLNEVTDIQRKQMTTHDDNIRAIAVNGKFDDCQLLVKKAFTDPLLSDMFLSSANSINTGRLLPQAVYYFYAWSRLAKSNTDKVIFSVPSGNYGNLMGGIIAREMGLPVSRLIIAANRNNEVPEYLRTGDYKIIHPSINCISNAMNVGHPSNLARIIALYGGRMNEKGIILREPDLARMRSDFFGTSISDDETRETIADCYRRFGLLLEPHGAIAWKSMELYMDHIQQAVSDDHIFISLETAHPAKFREEIKNILGFLPQMPDSLSRIEDKKENYTELNNNYDELREFILKL
jgi:threonine synthase